MKIPEYKNIDEKKNAFVNSYQIITSIKELKEFLNSSESFKNNIFRGVCEAKYKNFTSAQRKYMENDLTATKIENLIQKQIESVRREHKNLIGRYYKSLKISPNDFLYLGIAQHYGGISPLLDFTTDIKTALFFMTDGASFSSEGDDNIGNYFSLYYVSNNNLQDLNSFFKKVADVVSEKIAQLAGGKKIEIKTNNDIIALLADFDHFKEKKYTEPLLIPYNIVTHSIIINGKNEKLSGVFSISNLNIVAQKGCFVFYLPVENKGLQAFEKPLNCVDIHKSLIPYINEYTKLTKSNIYPDEYELVKDSCNKALRNILNK